MSCLLHFMLAIFYAVPAEAVYCIVGIYKRKRRGSKNKNGSRSQNEALPSVGEPRGTWPDDIHGRLG